MTTDMLKSSTSNTPSIVQLSAIDRQRSDKAYDKNSISIGAFESTSTLTPNWLPAMNHPITTMRVNSPAVVLVVTSIDDKE